MSVADPAARLRGTAAGLLTAALAVAAHAAGGGAPSTGAVVVQLAVLAATVGALAATIARAAHARVLLGLLAAGQLCGHIILSAVGHSHASTTAPPAVVMLAAHVVAIGAGALRSPPAIGCAEPCHARCAPRLGSSPRRSPSHPLW